MYKKNFTKKLLLVLVCILSMNLLLKQAFTQNIPVYDESVPKPTLSGISYGEHERHILDFWKAKSDSPTPLVFVIHGGGWVGGEKERVHRFADDPPVYLYYNAPPALGQNQKDPTHTANFGVKLKERCESAGIGCEVQYPDAPGVKHETTTDYLISKLKAPAKHKSLIDRKRLVTRHNVIISEPDKLAPLSVGNGKFCYTADITGMQTFPEFYQAGIPLSTMSEWGWHSFPNTEGFKLSDTYEYVDTYGRKVPYPLNQGVPGGEFLRANPHQLSLALVGLKLKNSNGGIADITEIKSINQELNIWKGVLTSQFEFEGKPVEVVTVCHPESDQLSFRISSPLLKEDMMAVQIFFPGASMRFGKDPAEFGNPENHRSEISSKNNRQIQFTHQLDDKIYYCQLNASANIELEDTGNHYYMISPKEGTNELSFSIDFSESKKAEALPGFENTLTASTKSRAAFWNSGAAVDLSESTDTRWKELERRIVLSQYLTAIQSRQKYSPQETGLTFNSWYGKFHLEMHWWHSVHFALWGRLEWLEKTLPWYEEIYDQAVAFAKEQGYKGVRWPKMVGPDGIDAPSGTGPLLIWQQPHTIYYFESLNPQEIFRLQI